MPGCQKSHVTAKPGLAQDSCTHMATVGVKGLATVAINISIELRVYGKTINLLRSLQRSVKMGHSLSRQTFKLFNLFIFSAFR